MKFCMQMYQLLWDTEYTFKDKIVQVKEERQDSINIYVNSKVDFPDLIHRNTRNSVLIKIKMFYII